MTLWAIVYTLDGRGRTRDAPYILASTLSLTRRGAWDEFASDTNDPKLFVGTMREKWGAKALKVKVEIVDAGPVARTA